MLYKIIKYLRALFVFQNISFKAVINTSNQICYNSKHHNAPSVKLTRYPDIKHSFFVQIRMNWRILKSSHLKSQHAFFFSFFPTMPNYSTLNGRLEAQILCKSKYNSEVLMLTENSSYSCIANGPFGLIIYHH